MTDSLSTCISAFQFSPFKLLYKWCIKALLFIQCQMYKQLGGKWQICVQTFCSGQAEESCELGVYSKKDIKKAAVNEQSRYILCLHQSQRPTSERTITSDSTGTHVNTCEQVITESRHQFILQTLCDYSKYQTTHCVTGATVL